MILRSGRIIRSSRIIMNNQLMLDDINVDKCKLIVGKIVSLHIDKKLLEKDGFLSLNKGEIPTIGGCDGYYIPKDYVRKEYQKVFLSCHLSLKFFLFLRLLLHIFYLLHLTCKHLLTI